MQISESIVVKKFYDRVVKGSCTQKFYDKITSHRCHTISCKSVWKKKMKNLEVDIDSTLGLLSNVVQF